MNEENCLLEANAIVESRQLNYGDPVETFNRVAKIVNLLLGTHLEGKHIAVIMQVIKMVRESVCHKDDNLVDEAGYILIQEMCNDKTRPDKNVS